MIQTRNGASLKLKFANYLKFISFFIKFKIIIFELENQLSLKENLIEQYAVALRTKEAQFNKLLSDATTCDRDSVSYKCAFILNFIFKLFLKTFSIDRMKKNYST